jgi:major membrane immunogen (membrane-anchored lipoprotein)
MNYQDAIRRINKLIGLYRFNSYKLKDSESELILEGPLAVEEPVYVITENGQLPAQDGEYELDDTTKIKIEDGKILEIKYDMEKNEKFVEATLKDGTVVKSPTFDVGEDVMIVTADGKETPAPDGEHELTLTDSEDKKVLIKIITKDGKIVERENVELPEGEQDAIEEEMGMTPDLSEGNDIVDGDFKKSVMGMLEEIKDAIKGVVAEQEDMKAKVAKFSKQPAGEPVKQPKNMAEQFNANKSDAFSKLLKIRHNI